MPLTIIADIKAKPGQETFIHDELQKLVAPTRKEAGCIQYDLHRDHNAPGHFLFVENWDNRELWQTHMSAPHLAAYLTATEGKVESFVVYEMEHVS